MKFADIPKFKSLRCEKMNISFDYLDRWINDMLNDGLQLNPDFQRGHVWTEEQQVKYVEYLLRGGVSGRAFYFNHPGWQGSWTGDFVCVDGLQRITACMKFLNDELRVFGHLKSEFEDRLRMADVTLEININRLMNREDVLEWYLELNDGGVVHSDEELDRVRRLLEDEKNKDDEWSKYKLTSEELEVLEMLDEIHKRPAHKHKKNIPNYLLYNNMEDMDNKRIKLNLYMINEKYPGKIVEFPSGQSVRLVKWRK